MCVLLFTGSQVERLKNHTSNKSFAAFFIGSEGVEEIKRHLFFASIDWNVSAVETCYWVTLIWAKTEEWNGYVNFADNLKPIVLY